MTENESDFKKAIATGPTLTTERCDSCREIFSAAPGETYCSDCKLHIEMMTGVDELGATITKLRAELGEAKTALEEAVKAERDRFGWNVGQIINEEAEAVEKGPHWATVLKYLSNINRAVIREMFEPRPKIFRTPPQQEGE